MGRDEIKMMARDWKIVAVDDDIDSVRLIQRCLAFYGAEAYITDKPEQALALIARVRPLFVLTDLAMPVLNGFELLCAVRSNERLCNIPVVALSAHAMLEMQEKVRQAGFDGYFTKPFAPSELVQSLAKLVGRWTVPQGAALSENIAVTGSGLLARVVQPYGATR